MKIIRLAVICFTLFNINSTLAFPNINKFVKSEYKYILQLDEQIFTDSLCIKDQASLSLNSSRVLNRLKKSLHDYKLKKKDLLLIHTFIYRAQLIVRFDKMIELNLLGEFSNASKRARMDLFRDYAEASAAIQARFQKKYNRIKG